MIDIQNEASQTREENQTKKGKKRAMSEPLSDDDESGDDMTMQVDIDVGAEGDPDLLVPMPEATGIEALRNKLHARMAELRNRGRPARRTGEPGDRDELLEERRRQRAAMRERRRKETKERIKRVEEMKGKKNKDNREERQKGNSTKVCQKYDSFFFKLTSTQ